MGLALAKLLAVRYQEVNFYDANGEWEKIINV
jgi:hypothetical protein